jgi:hypothetical protein
VVVLQGQVDPAAQHARSGPDHPVARYVNGLASGKSLSDDLATPANPDSAKPWSTNEVMNLFVSFLRHYEEPQRPDTTCC